MVLYPLMPFQGIMIQLMILPDEHSIIITANKRQVLALEAHYLAQQSGVMLLPEIIDYQSFLYSRWQQNNAGDARIVIDALQQFFIWSDIIRHPKNGQEAHNLADFHFIEFDNQLIKTVQSEYGLVRQFNIPTDVLASPFSSKGRLFATWIAQYRAFLSRHDMLDYFDLPKEVIKTNTTTKEFYHYGFKVLTPQQNTFFAKLSAQSLNITNHQYSDKTDAQEFTAMADEITSMASWAVKQAQDKSVKVAIVVPELAQMRTKICAELDYLLGHQKYLTSSVDKHYNISLGRPLSQYYLTARALDLLQISQQSRDNNIEVSLFNPLLTSALIIGAKHEQHQRYQASTAIKQLAKKSLSRDEIIQVLNNTGCGILVQCFSDLEQFWTELAQPNNHRQSHSKWMACFTELLMCWGFCQDRGFSSQEYQLFNKYQEAQLSFYRLDSIKSSVLFGTALADWRQVLALINFQPKLSQPSNLHILGQLEAQGLFFDKVWIMGMSSCFLPGKLKKFRFIEPDIALKYALPGSGYEQLNIHAKQTLRHLKNLTPTPENLYFSYAKIGLDQTQPRRISPLLSPVSPIFNIAKIDKITQQLTSLDDHKTTALTNKTIKRGTQTLSEQAQCPFRGFANRLNLVEINPINIGVSPMEKGNLIHKVLERLYKDIKDQKTLLEKQDELPELISQEIAKIYPNPDLFEQLEIQRAHAIILEFLELDCTREDFKITALEHTQKTTINGLSFTTRLDRLDQDSFGNNFIFDYKTSTTTLGQLGNTRTGFVGIITQAQLPIYAITNTIDGIAFISLKTQKSQYIGFAKEDLLSSVLGKKYTNNEQFSELINFWRTELNQSSYDFQQGKAAVLPSKTACKYCPLPTLCRV